MTQASQASAPYRPLPTKLIAPVHSSHVSPPAKTTEAKVMMLAANHASATVHYLCEGLRPMRGVRAGQLEMELDLACDKLARASEDLCQLREDLRAYRAGKLTQDQIDSLGSIGRILPRDRKPQEGGNI